LPWAFLSQDILKLPIKTRGQMLSDVRQEITHYNEMKNRIFDINLNMRDNARRAIAPTWFYPFHGQGN
jgi:hypothetical protein